MMSLSLILWQTRISSIDEIRSEIRNEIYSEIRNEHRNEIRNERPPIFAYLSQLYHCLGVFGGKGDLVN